jgi:hypothetical protein
VSAVFGDDSGQSHSQLSLHEFWPVRSMGMIVMNGTGRGLLGASESDEIVYSQSDGIYSEKMNKELNPSSGQFCPSKFAFFYSFEIGIPMLFGPYCKVDVCNVAISGDHSTQK